MGDDQKFYHLKSQSFSTLHNRKLLLYGANTKLRGRNVNGFFVRQGT